MTCGEKGSRVRDRSRGWWGAFAVGGGVDRGVGGWRRGDAGCGGTQGGGEDGGGGGGRGCGEEGRTRGKGGGEV